MKNFTLRGLRIFEVAATCESYSRAAEVLELSQPAVSMQVRQFEEEVGVRLFEKHARGVALTDAGRALLVHARDILARVRVAEDAMASLQGVFRGQLHLGVISPAHYFAPWLMQAFRSLYPDVRMKLTVAARDELLAALQEHRLDVAIAGFPPAHAAIEAETFARHPHCIVAAAGHRLAGRRAITWEELRDEPFVYREAGSATRQFLEHLLQSRKLQVNVTTELQGNETIKQAVMAGMGISFMSAHAIQVELAAERIVVLDVEGMPKMLDWCLLHRRDAPLSGVNLLFRNFVLDRGAEVTACGGC
jgi:LysR family transcriptional regulator, low CO2-responsive transcriptional regulator